MSEIFFLLFMRSLQKQMNKEEAEKHELGKRDSGNRNSIGIS